MTCSQLIAHLTTIRAELGDIDVRVDSDLFTDHKPRDVTSVGTLEFFVRDVQSIVIGQWPNEGVSRVVLYVGNEPKYLLNNAN